MATPNLAARRNGARRNITAQMTRNNPTATPRRPRSRAVDAIAPALRGQLNLRQCVSYTASGHSHEETFAPEPTVIGESVVARGRTRRSHPISRLPAVNKGLTTGQPGQEPS